MNDTDINAPVIKVVTLWAAVGITSWADAAAAAAFFYSIILITEWFWKKFWRPLLERKGVLRPKRRTRRERVGDTDLGALE